MGCAISLSKRSYLLFDLDGTVIDSSKGIYHSLQYMFREYGLPVPSEKELSAFIGPAIGVILRDAYGYPPEQITKMVALYREEYARQGVFECVLYPGIHTLFEKLRAQGKKVAIATKKPEHFAKIIVEHLDLLHQLDGVFGSPPEDHNDHKDAILLRALEQLGCADKAEALLIGDTRYDCIGAQLAGIDCVGVDYGFGARADLQAHGALTVAADSNALQELLCGKGDCYAGTP